MREESLSRACGRSICGALLATGGGIAGGYTPSAVAQESAVVEEVVVSARRRDERIEDVPISIAAFGGDDLAARQVDTTEELSQIAPNLQFSSVAPSSGNSSASVIFIRGVGQTDFIASTDPGVGFYVDGVYFARASGTAVSLLDVERIEVLRGPQGTLFGRNTVGGAIQVISTKPSFGELAGRAQAAVGRYSRYDVDAAINLPVSDTFAMRVAALRKERDGYVKRIFDGNDLGDVNTFATRVSLAWKPTEDFDLLWVNDYTHDDTNGSATVFGGIATNASYVRLAAANSGCTSSAATPVPENTDPNCPNNQWLALGPYKTASTGPLQSELEMYGTALTATWQASDALTIKSISAYRRTKPASMRDADNTPLRILESINRDDIEQVTQELQLLGTAFDERLHWQVGGYYFRETDDQIYPVYFPSSIVDAAETQVGGLDIAAGIKNASYAFFTQETLDITEELNLTLGLRYTDDTKEATPRMFPAPSIAGYTNVGYNVPDPTAPPAQRNCGPTGSCVRLGRNDTLFAQVLNKSTHSRLTPMASLQYRWTPDLMTYVSYSEGFKSGGFNTRIVAPVVTSAAPSGRESLPAFDPEEVQAYELGAKMQLFGALNLSAAVFRSDYKDIHIVLREGIAPIVRNAGEATIDGFELEGRFSPIRDFDVTFGVGYTDFGYKRFTPQLNASQASLAPGALGRVDLDDMQAYAPKWSSSLGIAYRIQTAFGSFTPRVDGSHRSKTYFDAPNTEQIAQPEYQVYNAAMRFESAGSAWSVTAGVTNFTDEAYRVGGNSSLHAGSGYAEVVYAPPRQWFLQASIDF